MRSFLLLDGLVERHTTIERGRQLGQSGLEPAPGKLFGERGQTGPQRQPGRGQPRDLLTQPRGLVGREHSLRFNPNVSQQFPLNPLYSGMRCPSRGCLSLGYLLSPHSGVHFFLAGIAVRLSFSFINLLV